MTITAGTKPRTYEIVALVGSGGMGDGPRVAAA
jgi:hypothetical protein